MVLIRVDGVGCQGIGGTIKDADSIVVIRVDGVACQSVVATGTIEEDSIIESLYIQILDGNIIPSIKVNAIT